MVLEEVSEAGWPPHATNAKGPGNRCHVLASVLKLEFLKAGQLDCHYYVTHSCIVQPQKRRRVREAVGLQIWAMGDVENNEFHCAVKKGGGAGPQRSQKRRRNSLNGLVRLLS